MKAAFLILICLTGAVVAAERPGAEQLFERYCLDCHDEDVKKGDFDLLDFLDHNERDGTLLFENLITGKMPPAEKKQPGSEEKEAMLKWLAARQPASEPASFRRVSRHEFVTAANDLLGTDLDLASRIPEDRGTFDFDSDRRISLSRELLDATFVFSWTRANNGNTYSFFIDNFEPPVAGWYELTFDAAKVGAFAEDVSLQVYAGKYYYADDRPQPQRLIDVISLGDTNLTAHSIRAYLHPGENVSVHCYSKHNFRQQNPTQGVYLKQLRARGPLLEAWPPRSYQQAFAGLEIDAPPRGTRAFDGGFQSTLQNIGGRISVSSFQDGMEMEKMQDGSNRTFWHTRFKPTLAKPPHFVVLENPRGVPVEGLSYATWTGGNGNGLVKGYEILLSADGISWSDPIVAGGLDIRLGNEQPIDFPTAVTNRFIKFLVTDAHSLDGRSLASIGKLDVKVAPAAKTGEGVGRTHIKVTASERELARVIRRFAERAFASKLSRAELAPYIAVGHQHLAEHGDAAQAARAAFKAVLCSPRFLMAPGEYKNESQAKAASLARTLWLSVPDKQLTRLAKQDGLDNAALRVQIRRMLADPKAERMVRSLAAQWLNLRSLDKVSPSLKLYPQYNDLLDHFLPLETEAYLHHLVTENLPVTTLIDADFSFLNQRLAQHYGIDGVTGQHLRKVSFGAKVPRGGLLTMGSILKVTTDGYDTSPILRGAWVSKNLIGTLSPPPESVEAIEPEHGAEAATLREQIERHKEQKTCYACHKSIDPYGFALESFDATGQWRTRYRVKQPHRGTFQYRPAGYFKPGGTVDPAGEIDTGAFEDVFGLKQLLVADHRKIAYNFAKKFYQYSTGAKPDLQTRIQLFGLVAERAEDCRVRDLMTEVLMLAFET